MNKLMMLTLGTGLLSASGTLCSPAFAEVYWAKDPTSGCEIWSDTPVENVIATWSGPCDDGEASGIGSLVWIENGELIGTYRGGMREGKLHGPGVLQVKAEDGSGFDLIEADFVEGEPSGPATIAAASGERFEGAIVGGAKDGFGIVTDADGNLYEGTFKNGHPDGFGYLRGVDGETYLGGLKEGTFDGEGQLLHANGEFYAGGFSNGVADGLGRYEDNSGGIYTGQFSNGKPNGIGTYFTQDGTAVQGKFVDQQPDGQILVTSPEGVQTVETWENGEKVQ